jgi:hypothetical protein
MLQYKYQPHAGFLKFIILPSQSLTPLEMGTKTFDCFPRLAAELREMIWERTLPRRTLWPNIIVNPDRPGHGGRRPDYGQNNVPVAFRVNRESRAVAMRSYHNREQYLSSGAPYVNFEIDEICILLDEFYDRNSRCFHTYMEIIGCDEGLLRVPKADLQKIRYLTVHFTACEICISRAAERFYKWYSDWTRPNVDAFKTLEEMTIEMDWKGVQRIQVEYYERFYRDIVRLVNRSIPDGKVTFYLQLP